MYIVIIGKFQQGIRLHKPFWAKGIEIGILFELVGQDQKVVLRSRI